MALSNKVFASFSSSVPATLAFSLTFLTASATLLIAVLTSTSATCLGVFLGVGIGGVDGVWSVGVGYGVLLSSAPVALVLFSGSSFFLHELHELNVRPNSKTNVTNTAFSFFTPPPPFFTCSI
jgi:hypothetical protein